MAISSFTSARVTDMKRKFVFLSLLSSTAILLSAIFGMLVFGACDANAIPLCDTVWVPLRAVDASGDEVVLNDIYNANYSNYSGSLSFQENNTFELWMGPGNPNDGTHSGMYEQKDGKINVFFDDDSVEQFDIQKNGDNTLIVVPYNGYEVYFKKQ